MNCEMQVEGMRLYNFKWMSIEINDKKGLEVWVEKKHQEVFYTKGLLQH